MPEANDHGASQPLQENIRSDEAINSNNKGNIDAHKLRESKDPDVNDQNEEFPVLKQIKTQR